MAGGPSTPELVAAVGDSGGLGFLAAGYLSADRLASDIARTRSLTSQPFGVNVFVPPTAAVDADAVAAYARHLDGEARRYGVALGDPVADDDAWDAKIALLLDDPVACVSFTFGCPPTRTVRALHDRGCAVFVTVTTADDASSAAAAGADALVAQGLEAGAHRGGFTDTGDGEMGLLPLVRTVAAVVSVPLLAAGGIADGRGVAAVLAAGADVAALGTALLLCPEAGTSTVHREALAGNRPTTLTRAFTGRRARGLVNRFVAEHSPAAPSGYPQVHHLTAPLRAAARHAGDPEGVHLWAGEAYRLAQPLPVARLVEKIGDEAADASGAAARRLRT